jgi:hypothetical protein
MSTKHTVTGDFFDTIRQSFDDAAAAEAAAEPAAPSAEDINGLSLDDYAGQREQLGIRHQASDFIGLSETDDRSGFPSWRTQQPEQIEFTEMDHYAEERTAAGIKTASAVFGAAPAQPRVNASPWSVT